MIKLDLHDAAGSFCVTPPLFFKCTECGVLLGPFLRSKLLDVKTSLHDAPHTALHSRPWYRTLWATFSNDTYAFRSRSGQDTGSEGGRRGWLRGMSV